jgi:protein-S-isoprenylcysteine O-methyltransferase Ste14
VIPPAGRAPRAAQAWGWSGALLFAGSLGYFLFTYALSFGETRQAAARGPAIVWDLALFSGFALHHSVFARERVRALVALPAGWLMYLPMAVGAWLSVRSAGAIDIWELAGVRQAGGLPPVTGSQEFKTSGPYGLVRHPIYLGWFLMVFGVPVMTGTRLVFALSSCAYLVVAVPLEERTLQQTTGGKYDEYKRQVRWRIVPGVY